MLICNTLLVAIPRHLENFSIPTFGLNDVVFYDPNNI